MMKKQLRRKADSVIIRNTLAFALGAVLAAAPAVCWAGASVKGKYESGGSVPYSSYESITEAVDEINTSALEGLGEDEEKSLSNDLSVDIHIDGDETVSGILLTGTKYDSDGNPELVRGFKDVSIDGHGSSLDGSDANDEDVATILVIANTSGDISISNLNFVNGRGKENDNDDPSVASYGGVGLLIMYNEAPGATTPAFETVTLTNITFQNNQGTITNGADSSGGGMTINSGQAGQGSTLSMTDLALVNNTSQTNIGRGLGTSNAFGGGAGLTNLDKIEYTGG